MSLLCLKMRSLCTTIQWIELCSANQYSEANGEFCGLSSVDLVAASCLILRVPTMQVRSRHGVHTEKNFQVEPKSANSLNCTLNRLWAFEPWRRLLSSIYYLQHDGRLISYDRFCEENDVSGLNRWRIS